jgi:hypothetical protein
MRIVTLIFLVLWLCINCSKAQKVQDDYSEEKIRIMLKTFYTMYITENSKIPGNGKKLDSLKKRYGTLDFIESINRKIAKQELDVDPFLKGQMAESPTLMNSLNSGRVTSINYFIMHQKTKMIWRKAITK